LLAETDDRVARVLAVRGVAIVVVRVVVVGICACEPEAAKDAECSYRQEVRTDTARGAEASRVA